MTYKTNTPNYKSKNVNNFSDFIDNIDSEKQELRDTKRGINPNTNDTQKFPKNTKFKYNKVTRKMDDLSADEIDDKIDALTEAKKDNLIASMSRFIDDYNQNSKSFEKRGMNEGIEILRSSSSLEEGIEKINKRIQDLNKTNKEFMPEENKKDLIKGLSDLVKHLQSKEISESKIDDDMFLRLTKKQSYKRMISEVRTAIDNYINTLEDFDDEDSEHRLALKNAVIEAANTALDL